MRPLCSVIFATYNRADLLARSVECYNRMAFPLDRLEVVVVDDGSTDGTGEVCEQFDPRIDLKYVRLRKSPGLWRDCASVINVGLRTAKGEKILATHPEILVGRDSVAACCDALDRDDVYACCKGYYMSQAMQAVIDSVPWRDEGPLAVRALPDFYSADPTGHPDYRPVAIERAAVWDSWIFGGHTRRGWGNLGGFIETQKWGSVDLLYNDRRRILRIENRTAPAESAFVVHQWHDSPRRMDEAFGESHFHHRVARWFYPHIDHLGPVPG